MLALRPTGDGVSLEVTRGVTRPVWEPDARVMALYETARGIARSIGFDITSQSSGGGSDGNFTGAMGIPTLDGLGVQGAGGHTLEEHLLVSSLVPRAKLIAGLRSEEHTSELQSRQYLVCRLLLEKKKIRTHTTYVAIEKY